MAFSRDWLEINPIDHLKFKSISGEVREFKVDVSDRLKTILSGFVSGETIVGIKLGRFLTTGTGARGAPSGTGTAAAFDVYTRTNGTGSVTELYLIGGTGGEIQLTNVGKIKAENIGGVYPAASVSTLTTILSLIYPVGSIYIETTGVNPATTFEVGTWAAFGAGKVMVGLNAADADFDTAEETGGAKTHTLLTAEMPAHTHTIGEGANLYSGYAQFASVINKLNDRATSSTGGGGAHNNLQPYIVKYVWQRTA